MWTLQLCVCVCVCPLAVGEDTQGESTAGISVDTVENEYQTQIFSIDLCRYF